MFDILEPVGQRTRRITATLQNEKFQLSLECASQEPLDENVGLLKF